MNNWQSDVNICLFLFILCSFAHQLYILINSSLRRGTIFRHLHMSSKRQIISICSNKQSQKNLAKLNVFGFIHSQIFGIYAELLSHIYLPLRPIFELVCPSVHWRSFLDVLDCIVCWNCLNYFYFVFFLEEEKMTNLSWFMSSQRKQPNLINSRCVRLNQILCKFWYKTSNAHKQQDV